MASPDIATDIKRLQNLAQERADIEGLVTKYMAYRTTSRALDETKAMLNDEW